MHNNTSTPPHHHHFSLKHFEQQQHQLQLTQFHQHQQQLNQSNNSNNNNSSSNASTPNSNTSFLIKDILRYEGQKRKQRKARTAFSDHQLRELESSFEAKKYLTVQDRIELANKLKLSDTQVKTWYQNRRTKHKRQTAVGYELLNEAQHLYAYQSVLQSQTNWMFGAGIGNPALSGASTNPQFNLAAAAALLAQASVQSGSLNAQQLNNSGSNNNNNMTLHHQQQQQQQDQANSFDNSAPNEPSVSPSSTKSNSPDNHRLKLDY